MQIASEPLNPGIASIASPLSATRITALILLSALLPVLAACQGSSIDSVMAVSEKKDVVAWAGPHEGLLAPFKESALSIGVASNNSRAIGIVLAITQRSPAKPTAGEKLY